MGLNRRHFMLGALAGPMGAGGRIYAATDTPRLPSPALERLSGRHHVVSVTEAPFGAKGDGAADDTKRIQAAIDAVSKGSGGIVFFPPGIYAITGRLVPKAGVSLIGAGNMVSVVKGARTLSRLLQATSNISDVSVSDLGWDANGYNAADFWTAIQFSAVDVQRIRVSRNRIFDSSYPGNGVVKQRQGIVIMPAIDVWIMENDLSHGCRIKFGRGSRGSSYAARNVWCQRNKLDYINDNGITFVSTGTASSALALSTQNVHVTDNVVNDPTNVGIFFGADGQANDDPDMDLRQIHVCRNTITGAFASGIACNVPAGSCEDIHVDGNIIVRSGMLAKANVGIKVHRADNAMEVPRRISVRHNTISGAGATANSIGIVALPGVTDAQDYTIAANKINGFETGIDTNAGTRGRLTRWHWLDNEIVGAATGIRIRGNPAVTNSDIERNRAIGCAGDALQVTSSEQVELRVKHNDFRDPRGSAVKLSASSSSTPGGFLIDLIGNDFRGTGVSAVQLRDGATFHASSVQHDNRGWDAPDVAITIPAGSARAGEAILIATELPQGVLSAAGKRVQIIAWGTTASNSNRKEVKLYFGTAAIITVALTARQAGIWKIVADVVKTNANAQSYVATLWETSRPDTPMTQGSTTAADGAKIDVKCTGTIADGGGGIKGNNIVQEGLIVRFMR